MKNIIINYLNDTISEEDLATLTSWLKKPKNQEKFKEFVQLNHELNVLHGHVDVQQAYENISKLIKQTPVNKSIFILNVFKYAAILVGISIIGYGVYQNFSKTSTISSEPQITLQLEDGSIHIVNDNQNTTIIDLSGRKISEQKDHQLIYSEISKTSQTLQYNTLVVPYGKTFQVILSDDTKVTLNAGSEFKYPIQFIEKEKNRTVFLSGEAFFEVSKNVDHPFVVTTQDMDVEVLGTHFNVTSYKEDHKTSTVLVKGKVATHNKLFEDDTKTLNPNERVFFKDTKLEIETVNVQKYVAWVDGQLVFVDDSFSIIINKLERKYNVKIKNLYEALDSIKITAIFKNETIDQVLKTFQTYEAFDYTIKNGVITITKPK